MQERGSRITSFGGSPASATLLPQSRPTAAPKPLSAFRGGSQRRRLVGSHFYAANTDSTMHYACDTGDTASGVGSCPVRYCLGESAIARHHTPPESAVRSVDRKCACE